MNLFLIDVDNTLYPRHLGVFNAIDVKINEYMEHKLGIDASIINRLRLLYWNKYGTTMAGLIKHYNIDPYDFLEYVHDIDVESLLKPNPELLSKIKSIDAVKIAFTNAPKKHAVRVMESLGIIDQFVDIFDIISADFKGKPDNYAYQKVVRKTKADGYAMIDDYGVNLKTAKDMGIFTILVGKDCPDYADLCVEKFEDIQENDIGFNGCVC